MKVVPLLLLLAACKNKADEICDDDGDGFVEDVCAAQATLPGGDCDDDNASVHPDAVEVCNGIDDNCNAVDEDDEATDRSSWYRDGDADEHGTPDDVLLTCEVDPAGYVSNQDDCDDNDADVQMRVWFADVDQDDHGDPEAMGAECVAPDGYVASNDDCNDANDAVNPQAEEICDNGVDDNCDDSAAGCGLYGSQLTADGIRLSISDETLAFAHVATDVDGDGVTDLIATSFESTGAAFLGPLLFSQSTPDAVVENPAGEATTITSAGSLDSTAGDELVVSGGGVYVLGWNASTKAFDRVVGGIQSSTIPIERTGLVGTLVADHTGLIACSEGYTTPQTVNVVGTYDVPSSVVDESSLDFRILGEHPTSSFGPDLVLVDLDADGVDSIVLAVASPGDDSDAYVWDAVPSGTVALTDADATVTDGEFDFAQSLLVLPDSDLDGRPSLAIASSRITTSEGVGAVYVLEGSQRTPDAATTQVLAAAGDNYFGFAMGYIPQFTEDESPLLAITSPQAESDVSGRTRLLALPLSPGTVLAADASVGTIRGSSLSASGFTAIAAGDQDNDGHSDIAIGSAASASPGIFILFGSGL